MQKAVVSAMVGAVLLGYTQPLRAYQPPLTDVQASVETNEFNVTVMYEVFDPALGSSLTGNRPYEGSAIGYWVIEDLVVADGVVAWLALMTGSSTSLDVVFLILSVAANRGFAQK